MTSTLLRRQAIINELAELCRKHRIVLVGTCESEGIYGEITIIDADNSKEGGCTDIEKFMNSDVEEYPPGNFKVNSIGELNEH